MLKNYLPDYSVKPQRKIIGLLLVLTWPVASWGQRAAALKNFPEINAVFASRLETSFSYQQELLPQGASTSISYLKFGGRHYTLAACRTIPAVPTIYAIRQVQEGYVLYKIGNELVPLLQSRCIKEALSSAAASAPQQYAYTSIFINNDAFQQSSPQTVVISQSFDPLSLLDKWPTDWRAGKHAFAVFKPAAAHPRDTAASYRVKAIADLQDTVGYRIEFVTRAYQAGRQWDANQGPDYTWTVMPVGSSKTSWVVKAQHLYNGGSTYWMRLYQSPQSFSETSESNSNGPGSSQTHFLSYRRYHRQRGRRAVDLYILYPRTLTGPKAAGEVKVKVITKTR